MAALSGPRRAGALRSARPWLAVFAAAAALAGLAAFEDSRSAAVARVAALVERKPEAPLPLSGEAAVQLARRVTVAHDDAQAVWRHYFRMRLGRSYAEPELVLYSRRTPTPCADADGATGPFYCAADRFAAYDLVFFDGLDEAVGGDSPRATPLMVAQIAASHVQNLLGILRDVERLRLRSDTATRAATDLRVALQADCLAGVWARRAGSRLGPVEPGGYAAVVAAAREIAVELEGRGHTAPSSYAALHLGAPEEREAGFTAGYERGALEDCLAPGLGGQLG